MNVLKHFRKLSWLALALWAVVPLPMIAQALPVEVSTAVKVADVAREKDVVWLCIVLAIVSIGFSAWLVREMIKMSQRAHEAQIEEARAIYALRDELAKQYKTKGNHE
jgi:hypothetical protein